MRTLESILNKDSNNLALIRIILASLVVYEHAFALTGFGNSPWNFIVYTYGKHVNLAFSSIFLFLAGLLACKTLLYKNTIYFCKGRFFRLYPLVFITTLFFAVIIGPLLSEFSFTQYFYSEHLAKFLISNLSIVQLDLYNDIYASTLPGFEGTNNLINGTWWMLPTLFNSFILLVILKIIGLFKNRLILSIILLVILSSKFWYIDTVLFVHSRAGYLLFTAAFYIFLGCLVFVWSKYIPLNWWIVCLFSILAFISYGTKLYGLFLSFAVIFFTLQFSTLTWIKKIHIKYDISYFIYIFGWFVQQLLIYLYPTINPVVNTIATLVICFILGKYSYLYIEKPCQTLLKK